MNAIQQHLSSVTKAIEYLNQSAVEKFVQVLKIVRLNQGTVYLFGNGGSHSTASHFANDLMKIGKVKAVCVGNMESAVFAYGNDQGWESMYSAPLEKLLGINDGVVGISCSGESANVLNALRLAISKGNLAMGLTGDSRVSSINRIRRMNALVHVPAGDIRVQEDVHLMICHAIVRSMQEKE